MDTELSEGTAATGSRNSVALGLDEDDDSPAAVENSQLAMLSVSLPSPSRAPSALLRRSVWSQGTPRTA